MAKAMYIGVSSKARKAKKAYIGVGGVAKKIKKMYIGVSGKARLFWSGVGSKALASFNNISTDTGYVCKLKKSEQEVPTTFTDISYPTTQMSESGYGMTVVYDYVNGRFLGVSSGYGSSLSSVYYMPDGTDTWTLIGQLPNGYRPTGSSSSTYARLRIDPKDGNLFIQWSYDNEYNFKKVYLSSGNITGKAYSTGYSIRYCGSCLSLIKDYYMGTIFQNVSGSYNYCNIYVIYIPKSEIDTGTGTVVEVLGSSVDEGRGYSMIDRYTHPSIGYYNGTYYLYILSKYQPLSSYYSIYLYKTTNPSAWTRFAQLSDTTPGRSQSPLCFVDGKFFFAGSGTTLQAIDCTASSPSLYNAGSIPSTYLGNQYYDTMIFNDGTKWYITNERGGNDSNISGLFYTSNGVNWTRVSLGEYASVYMDVAKEKEFFQ